MNEQFDITIIVKSGDKRVALEKIKGTFSYSDDHQDDKRTYKIVTTRKSLEESQKPSEENQETIIMNGDLVT